MNTTCEATRLYVSRWGPHTNEASIKAFKPQMDASDRNPVTGAPELPTHRLFDFRKPHLTKAELLKSINRFLHQFERELPGRHFSCKRRGLT